MDLRIDESGPFTVAHVSGRLNAENAEEFMRVLQDHAMGEDASVAVDLSQVDLVDSSGLSALVSLVTRARLTEGRVLLVAPSPFIAEVFSVTALDQWFEVCESLEEAGRRLA